MCQEIGVLQLHLDAGRDRADDIDRAAAAQQLADERVQCSVAGQVVRKLKTPWHGGTTYLVMSPLELTQLRTELLLCGNPIHWCYFSIGSAAGPR